MFGDPEAALLAIEDFLDITGGIVNSAEAFLLQAPAYGDLDQSEDAVISYNKAIQFDPEYTLAYYNRGNLFALLGQYSRAIEDYNKAIRNTRAPTKTGATPLFYSESITEPSRTSMRR